MLQSVLDFLSKLLLSTLWQIVTVMGAFLFFGTILYILARTSRKIHVNRFGYGADLYITAWIGTPVHELGHALFSILFGHKIHDISLYSPNNDDCLGYVSYSYNHKNPWCLLGTFFSSIGPILLGSLVIYFMVKLMLPNGQTIINILSGIRADFSSFNGFMNLVGSIVVAVPPTLNELWNAISIGGWKVWLFIYLSICISAHMELSPADFKCAIPGVVLVIVVALIINLICLIFGINPTQPTMAVGRFIGISAGLFTLSTILSATCCIVSLAVGLVFSIFKR